MDTIKKFNGLHDFIKFISVGVINTLIGLSICFIFLNMIKTDYWTATMFGNIVGAINSFVLNRKYTFNNVSSIPVTFIKFSLGILVCYFCSYWISSVIARHLMPEIWWSVHKINVNNIAVLIGSCLYTISNYCVQKYLVFRNIYVQV